MEAMAGAVVVGWACPHGCRVQLTALAETAYAIDEDGDLVKQVDLRRFARARYVHMRLMHGAPRAEWVEQDDDDD